MSLTAPPTGFQLKGWHVAAIITGFFTIVVALDTTFAVIALRTFPGEVSATPYEDGVAYNRQLARLAAQSARGWRATAGLASDGRIEVGLRDRAGTPVSGATVTALLERPATETGHRTVTFVEAAPGTYLAPGSGLTGAWDVTITARGRDGARLDAHQRLVWP